MKFVVLAVCAALIIFWISWRMAPRRPPVRLRVENARHITAGMPLGQVEALLGGPVGDYGRYHGGATYIMLGCDLFDRHLWTERVWFDDKHRVEVYFDPQDRVVHWFRPIFERTPPETMVRLLNALGL